MARQRFIHPDIWTDPSFGLLTSDEKILFIGLISNADDEGRMPGHPAYLRNMVFPYNDFTNAQVKAMRDRIAKLCHNVHIYEVDGVEYIALLKWSKYQAPRYAKPSKYPAPNDCKVSAEKMQDDDETDTDMSQACNQADESLQPNSSKAVTKKTQGFNQIDASLQPKSCDLATTDSNLDSGSDLDSDSNLRESVTEPSQIPSDFIPYQNIVDVYNSTCTGLPRVKALTDLRRRAIRARWNFNKPDPMQHFKELFTKAGKSDFLNGINDRAWIADFDWLMKEQNAAKVLEGKYDNSAKLRASPGGKGTWQTPMTVGERNAASRDRSLRNIAEYLKREEQKYAGRNAGDETCDRESLGAGHNLLPGQD